MASKHLVPEQQNFVRLSLVCVDEIRVMLGYILKCQIPPEDLFKTIQANTTLLTGNQKLSPEQLKLCYNPRPFVPDYQCFDITLLYKLIRNLCQTLQPSQGWGQKPHKTDIKIGDDIERLRLFRNEMVGHAGSSSVPDGIFASKWSELESTFKRIQGFLSSNGITKNFVEQLVSLKRTDFGWQDYEKSEMRLMFERIKLTETPKLTVQGDEQKIWGEKACFMARYEDGDTSNNWPITWQKIRGNTIEQLDISTERYRGSSSQQLVIPTVSKDDQGEYRATVLREEKGTHILIPSNTIYLTVTGDLPTLEIENAKSEDDRITMHYNVSVDDQSPAVHSVTWTKDGEHLEKTGDKYSGGQLMDTYLTIHSPTSNDAGQYSFEVSNAVGPVTKSVHLSVPSVSIIEVPEVIVGNPIIIVPTIQSCPTPVSAIWQKNNRHNIEEFERLEINDAKYFGSSDDPDDPRLVIQKVTQEDALYYRLIVSNGIGQSASNTIYLKLIGGVPSLYVHHETHIMEKSVTLVCEMTVPINSPTVSDVFWTKDDRKIDITGSGGKYSGGSIANPSLCIKMVNSNDEGMYQCCASNSVGEMCSEKIYLGPPRIEFDSPDFDDFHKTVTYIATIKSIPVALNAEWKVKQDRNDRFQVIDMHDPLYKGSVIALPRPKLVVNKHKAEQVESFQLEVFNFIASSRRNTKDRVVESSDANINQEISNSLKTLYSNCSYAFFANLSDDLAESLPENKLERLKHLLTGVNSVDAESIKEVTSIRGFFMLLQEKQLFTKTDVLFMQLLLRKVGCKELYEKCIQYARKQRALCLFEKDPDNGFKHVQFHIAGNLQIYSNKELHNIRNIVIAFLGCKDDDVVLDGIHLANSFFVVLGIREIFVKKLLDMDQQHIQQLCDLKVDYFILDHEKHNINILQKESRELDIAIQKSYASQISHLLEIIFRRILRRYVPESDFVAKIQECKEKFLLLLDDAQQSLLYPKRGSFSVSYSHLDLNLLYILLKSICDIAAHERGWGNSPTPTDTSLAANIDRIMDIHKTYCGDVPRMILKHSDFDKVMKKVIHISGRIDENLDGSTADVSTHDQDTTTIHVPEEVLRPLRYNIIYHYSKENEDVIHQLTQFGKQEEALEALRERMATSPEMKKSLDRQHSRVKKSKTIQIDYCPRRSIPDFVDVRFTSEIQKNPSRKHVRGSYPTKTKEEKWREKNKSSKSNADMIGVPEHLISREGRTITSPEIEKSLEPQYSRYQSDVRRTDFYQDFDDDIFTSVIRKDSSRISSHGSYPTKIEEEKWREKKKSSKSNADLIGWKHPEHLISPKGISLSQKVGFSASQISSITTSFVRVRHISVVTSDRLWVSYFMDRLLQVDSSGRVLHDKPKVRYSFFSFRYEYTGSHTVTEDGDLLFIEGNEVRKLTSDETVITLLTTDGKAYCIHSSRINGDILVGCIGEVTRYDRRGRKLQVINEDDKGQGLYELPFYITENKNGDIWISDMDKRAVVVVDKSERHRFDYTGRQSDYTGRQSEDSSYMYHSSYTGRLFPFLPRGICTDVLGHVLVCDFYNDSVHLLDQDGQFLSLLLTREQHGIHFPTALCVDDQHNLYLIQFDSNTINVYKYLKDTDFK